MDIENSASRERPRSACGAARTPSISRLVDSQSSGLFERSKRPARHCHFRHRNRGHNCRRRLSL
jgi:hypothetical protein